MMKKMQNCPLASRLFLCLYTTIFQPLQLDVVTKVTSLVACNLRVRCPETLALFLYSAAHSVRGSWGGSCSSAQQTLRQLIRGLWKNQYCDRDSKKTFSIKFTHLTLHFMSIFFCAKVIWLKPRAGSSSDCAIWGNNNISEKGDGSSRNIIPGFH